jgi:hypothetical protein
MKSRSEREAIDAALKRAGKTAVSGTREERSGRFIPVSEARRNAASVLSQDSKKKH